jgi:hypothetical protein
MTRPVDDRTPTPPIDTDDLPPTQYLITEVLAARHRTGEHMWTFPSRLRAHMTALGEAGLIGWKSGIEPNTIRAWLTDAGRASVLGDGYVTPNDAAPAKLAAVWELYAEYVQEPSVSTDLLLWKLGNALRGEA